MPVAEGGGSDMVTRNSRMALAVVLLAAWAAYPAVAAEPPQWIQGDLTRAKSEAARANRPILLLLYAPGSRACESAQERVFSQPEFARAAEGWILAKLDVSRDKGLVEKQELEALPTTAFITAEGEELGRIVGVSSIKSYLSAMADGLLIFRLKPIDPPKLSTADADEYVAALLRLERGGIAAAVLKSRVESGQLSEAELRRSQILLGSLQCLLGDVEAGRQTLAEVLAGARVVEPVERVRQAVDHLTALGLMEPGAVVPAEIDKPAGEPIGAIVARKVTPEELVQTVEQMGALARGETPAGMTEADLGAFFLRLGNALEAMACLDRALASASDGEAEETLITLRLAAACIIGPDPGRGVRLIDELLTKYPESGQRPFAMYLAAIGCWRVGDETKYRIVVDYLHEHFPDTVWARRAEGLTATLKALKQQYEAPAGTEGAPEQPEATPKP
ncbi:MAG TPA: thioredoxin family protein [Armatimonadota bacterium]|nr:thioredoxin family protein [Armatimonadota bacterium]HQK93546.1 thioredoxin family protein [Armatimonadota bacterium]